MFFSFLAIFLLFCDKKVQRKIQKEFFFKRQKKVQGKFEPQKKIQEFFFIQKTEKAPVKKVLRVFFKEKNILEREQKYFNKQIFRR